MSTLNLPGGAVLACMRSLVHGWQFFDCSLGHVPGAAAMHRCQASPTCPPTAAEEVSSFLMSVLVWQRVQAAPSHHSPPSTNKQGLQDATLSMAA